VSSPDARPAGGNGLQTTTQAQDSPASDGIQNIGGQAGETAGNPVPQSESSSDQWFVVHSTGGTDATTSRETAEGYRDQGRTDKGHVYIFPNGSTVQVVPYDQDATATRTETPRFTEAYDPDAVGKMVHVELVLRDGDAATPAQYDALATAYEEASSARGMRLNITAHREVDRGVDGGHGDPTNSNINFDTFYRALSDRGISTAGAQRITQDRFSIPNQRDMTVSWPPAVAGPVSRDPGSKKQDIHNTRGPSEAGAPRRWIIHRVWADRSHGCGWNRFTFAIR